MYLLIVNLHPRPEHPLQPHLIMKELQSMLHVLCSGIQLVDSHLVVGLDTWVAISDLFVVEEGDHEEAIVGELPGVGVERV